MSGRPKLIRSKFPDCLSSQFCCVCNSSLLLQGPGGRKEILRSGEESFKSRCEERAGFSHLRLHGPEYQGHQATQPGKNSLKYSRFTVVFPRRTASLPLLRPRRT